MSEDNKFQHHLNIFAEAYVALRPRARGHRIPCRTQPLAYNYHIKAHIRLEQAIITKYKADSNRIYLVPTYVQVINYKSALIIIPKEG